MLNEEADAKEVSSRRVEGGKKRKVSDVTAGPAAKKVK